MMREFLLLFPVSALEEGDTAGAQPCAGGSWGSGDF